MLPAHDTIPTFHALVHKLQWAWSIGSPPTAGHSVFRTGRDTLRPFSVERAALRCAAGGGCWRRSGALGAAWPGSGCSPEAGGCLARRAALPGEPRPGGMVPARSRASTGSFGDSAQSSAKEGGSTRARHGEALRCHRGATPPPAG